MVYATGFWYRSGMFQAKRGTAPIKCEKCGGDRFAVKANSARCTNCGEEIKLKGVAKYGNTKQTHGGYSYMSKLEARQAAEMDIRIAAGDIVSYERQVKIPLEVAGVHICNYYIDFVVTENDGTQTYVEVKGFETNEWKLKWKLFCALFPNVKKIIIK